MRTIDLHDIVNTTTEQDVHHKIHRETFFKMIEDANIDLKKLMGKRKKTDYRPYHDFNFIVKELHEKKYIDITEICIYLETELMKVKDIMACLNEENLYSLRCSLAERNNIKVKRNSLDSFMYN